MASIPLPFVVAPKQAPTKVRLGTEESGVIEIDRLGYLTTGEKSAFQQVDVGREGQSLMLDLVNKLEKDTKKSRKEILDALATIGSETEELPEYLSPYTSELVALIEAFQAEADKIKVVKAYIMLAFRLQVEYTFDQVLALHPDLLTGLAELYDAEEKRSLASLPSEYVDLMKVENSKKTRAQEAAEVVKQGKSKAQT